MMNQNKKTIESFITTAKLKRNSKKIEDLYNKILKDSVPCTGGRRVTFTNRQLDEIKKIHKELFGS
jgi:hypothetical protein